MCHFVLDCIIFPIYIATTFLKGPVASLYERSLFERFEQSGYPVHMLRTQVLCFIEEGLCYFELRFYASLKRVYATLKRVYATLKRVCATLKRVYAANLTYWVITILKYMTLPYSKFLLLVCFFSSSQYRMHPSISAFPSLHFYGGRLLNSELVCGPSLKDRKSVV